MEILEAENEEVDEETRKLITRLYRRCNARRQYWVNNTSLHNDTTWCPVIFDGYENYANKFNRQVNKVNRSSYLCWGPTKADTTEIRTCPNYVIGYDERLTASKVCLPNGTWWRQPGKDDSWSNYTTCIDHRDYESRQLINDIYFYGYCLSLFTLIISLIIFLSFRSLQCTRIRIHTQLFSSLALSCTFWILWYKLVVGSNDVIASNPSWCAWLHIVTQYLTVCNYFWMFCEGIHLHLVLVVVFIKDIVAMRIFIVIGWVLPSVFVAAYSFFRSRSLEDSKLCWIDESHFMWILTVPIIILLVCSTIFIINIVRILITKLHPKSISPAPMAVKKAVRATFILIPLFGLQLILLPFRPEKESSFELPYQLIAAVLISLQGLCVSFLFCFVNHEVVTAVSGYLSSLCPRLFTTYYRKSHYPPPATEC